MGKNISDKASVCTHCGYPLSLDNVSAYSYKIIVTQYQKKSSSGNEMGFLGSVTNFDFSKRCEMINTIPHTMLTHVSETNKNYLLNIFERQGIVVTVEEIKEAPNKVLNDKIFDYIVRVEDIPDPRPPKCPKCGCKELTVTSRGYDLLLGFVGSSKPYNVCNKCGYRWAVGRKE